MNNNLTALNNYLFEQLERINDDELKPEEFETEIKRAETVVKLSKAIVDNANLALQAQRNFDAMALKTVYRKLIGKWGLMSIDYRTADKETVALATAIAEDGNDNIIDLDVDGFTVEEEVTANE